MEQGNLSELRLRLYVDFLQLIALEDPTLVEVVDGMTLGLLMADITHSENTVARAPPVKDTDGSEVPENTSQPNEPLVNGTFSKDDLLTFGTRDYRHLDISVRRRIVEEIGQVLRSIAEIYQDEKTTPDNDLNMSELPQKIQSFKNDLEKKTMEVVLASQRIATLIDQITKKHTFFDCEMKQAISVTLPAYKRTRNASIDLLATSIEASLVRLSLARARAERALYDHKASHTSSDYGTTVAKALEEAYASLKKDEEEMKLEDQTLDLQLREYESLMQLVDGGGGGYRQIVNDWAKVKQETDECLRDLRRLGWTGD